jgi:hypothetical protein
MTNERAKGFAEKRCLARLVLAAITAALRKEGMVDRRRRLAVTQ